MNIVCFNLIWLHVLTNVLRWSLKAETLPSSFVEQTINTLHISHTIPFAQRGKNTHILMDIVCFNLVWLLALINVLRWSLKAETLPISFVEKTINTLAHCTRCKQFLLHKIAQNCTFVNTYHAAWIRFWNYDKVLGIFSSICSENVHFLKLESKQCLGGKGRHNKVIISFHRGHYHATFYTCQN